MDDIKIPTMFKRGPKEMGYKVIPEIMPGCEWITQTGNARIALKLDGYCFKVIKGTGIDPDQFLKRSRQVKDGEIHNIWRKLDRGILSGDDKKWWDAYDECKPYQTGLYEIIGPDIKGNPHGCTKVVMKRVLPAEYSLNPSWNETNIKLFNCDITKLFNDIRAELADPQCDVEGIVIQEEKYGIGPQNNCVVPRACKVKKRDFGIPWPAPTTAVVPVSADPWNINTYM